MGFGSKVKNQHLFGKKNTRKFVHFGRKATTELSNQLRNEMKALDKATPALAMAANMYAPGSGKLVIEANKIAQAIHTGARQKINQNAPHYGTDRRQNAQRMKINFAQDQTAPQINPILKE